MSTPTTPSSSPRSRAEASATAGATSLGEGLESLRQLGAVWKGLEQCERQLREPCGADQARGQRPEH